MVSLISMDLESLKNNLKNSNLKNLENQIGVSRGSFYNFLNGENVTLDFLKKLESYFKAIEKEKSYHLLKYFGAPLALPTIEPDLPFLKNRVLSSTSLKEVAQKGLVLAAQDPLIESIYPFFLYKNLKDLNLEDLYRFSVTQELDGLFCYHLEIINAYNQSPKIISFLKKVRALFNYSLRKKKKVDGTLPNKYELLLCKKNELALKWGLYLNANPDDYIHRFKKWDRPK